MDIAAIARQSLEPVGYEVLEAVTRNTALGASVFIRIDRLDEQPVSVDDLARASSVLGLELDRLDPIQGQYNLEVESPGPKRPLTRARHFERFLGLRVKVKRQGGSFVGKVLGVNGDLVSLEGPDGTPVTLPAGEIKATLAEWPSEHR
ncbi:MAG TPA: ribosome maturation factor RimP [Deinococcales bacterium]|nr:ribosome maturation factor RimP [Deinococcales bacterium]